MAQSTIIDGLFCIPQKPRVPQPAECVPFDLDLAPAMHSTGIAGAVLAHGNCWQCQHHWNCADLRTHEIVTAAARNPGQLRGLASYDPLRIGASLRWIEDAVVEGGTAGAYAEAESCASGLDAPRMYPLYGLCAMLRLPMVVGFHSGERWTQHLPQAEVLAADFPDLDLVLAPPAGSETECMVGLMQRFPRISFLLCPQDLESDAALCEYIEQQGREHVLFRSGSGGWSAAVESVRRLPLGPEALRAYLFENAARVYGFPVAAAKVKSKR
jgi:predicted TIM-barrel fold metal-dependent hydrolase